MIAMGLLAAVGVGAMYITKNQSQTKTTLTAKNDVEQTVVGYETILSEPAACGALLKGLTPGTSINELKDITGKSFLKVGDPSAGGFHKVSSIKLGALDPVSRTIRMSFVFEGQRKGASSVTKFVTITPIMNGGAIDGCINPFDLASDAVLKKMCMDVDPLKVGDCTKNLEHLMAEVKELYCEAHPLLAYDPVLKKCRPLDANKSCGGNFLQGYDGTGKLNCYAHDTSPAVPARNNNPPVTPPVTPPPLPPTGCTSWSNWLPVAPSCSPVSSGPSRYEWGPLSAVDCSSGTGLPSCPGANPAGKTCGDSGSFCKWNKPCGDMDMEGNILNGPGVIYVSTCSAVDSGPAPTSGTLTQTRTCIAGNGSPETRTIPAPSSCVCSVWNDWLPQSDSVCLGQSMNQTRKCAQAGFSDETRVTMGTKLDGVCAKPKDGPGDCEVTERRYAKFDCSGGQMPLDTISLPVSNKAACEAYCSASCKGGIKYANCRYSPY